jgi:hypothetical protein
MKNAILFFAVLLIIGTSAQASNILTGDSNTSYGQYTLVQQENAVVVNNVAYKAWTLKYEGLNKSFTVLYAPALNGNCCFTIRNENFEIQYANQEGNFGVRLVAPDCRKVSKKEVMRQINNEQFMMQSLLTSNMKTEEEYLGLVACFLPLLFS